jgi:hypothetical protein
LTGLSEDDAVVSYHGRCAPVVAVSLASSRSSEPATKHQPTRPYTTTGDATNGGQPERTPSAAIAAIVILGTFRLIE